MTRDRAILSTEAETGLLVPVTRGTAEWLLGFEEAGREGFWLNDWREPEAGSSG